MNFKVELSKILETQSKPFQQRSLNFLQQMQMKRL